MNRLLQIMLILVLSLALCAFSGSAGLTVIEEEAVPAAVTLAPEDSQWLVLVDREAGEEVKQGARKFCQKIGFLSGGQLTATLQESSSVLVDMAILEADFAFLSGGDAPALSKYFSTLNEPFTYTSYTHFTMALNSRNILETVSRDVSDNGRLIPIAAYYQGSKFLLSTMPLVDHTAFQGVIIDGSDGPEEDTQPLVLVERLRKWEAAALLGARLEEEKNSGARVQSLLDGGAKIIELDFGDLPPEISQVRGEDYYLTRTWHGAEPLWLMERQETSEKLSPYEQALVKEAAAYVFPVLDQAILDREEEAVLTFLENSVTIRTDFYRTRQIFQDLRSGRGLDRDQQLLLEYIDSILV